MTGRGEKRPMLNPNLASDTVVEQVDANGSVTLIDGKRRLGQIFPAVVGDPGGAWFGRRYGKPARLFESWGGREGRADARRYVLGELE